MRTLTKEEYEETVQLHFELLFGEDAETGSRIFCRVFNCVECPVRKECGDYLDCEFRCVDSEDSVQGELFALETIYDYGVANGLVAEGEKP